MDWKHRSAGAPLSIAFDPEGGYTLNEVYLDGTELDFAKEGLNEGFRFNNPNVRGECGCGESFSVDG